MYIQLDVEQIEELIRWQLCYSEYKLREHIQLCNLRFPFLGVDESYW